MARLCMCAAICLALALAPLTFAAWPNDPAQNLVICNCLGQQIAPKLATTSSGGCYIGWYDNDSGNFDVYLQRLNEHGVPQWQENGVCVDGNPQLAQITDWDLAVDHSDHCVVAVNDARGGGGNLNVYGYRIGPGCSFDWGGGGLAMSDNDDREPDPRLAVTTGGNVVFVWEQETATGSVVNLRKVNPDGGNCWFPYTLTLSSDHGISAPRVVACEDDGVIVQYLKAQSSDPQGERYIYVQKFNSQAVSLWPNGGVAVCTAGGIESGAEPEIIADGRGGIYCYWHDARIPDSYHAYVQHIDSSGTPLWTENGVRLSLTETQLQMKPALVAFPGTGEVMAFYETTDANHTPHGLAGQLISAAGDRPWGYHGVTFVPMGELSPCNILAFPLNDGAIVVYREFAPGSTTGTVIKAFRVDHDGTMVWPNSPTDVCAVPSEKSCMSGSMNGLGQVIVAWTDMRVDASGDLYLQNINPDGTLGDYTPEAADDRMASRSDEFALKTNYPNPFNAVTRIAFALPRSVPVELVVYNLIGQEVARLVDGPMAAGEHELLFDGAGLASGTYVYRLTTNDFTAQRTMILTK